jgi:hypothetical protein
MQDKAFGEERLLLDDGIFLRCAFSGTTLVFCGGKAPQFERCTLENVSFDFQGSALNTIETLRWLRKSGQAEVIEGWLGGGE